MDFRDRRGLRDRADRALEAPSWDPKKLMLLYTGATAAVMLLVTALNFILQGQIAGTGGLSGLGTRAVLETVIEVARVAVNLLLPFWTLGYLSCVLKMLRGQAFGPGDMLWGFRNFGPALRLNLLRGLTMLVRLMLSSYAALFLSSFIPVSDRVMEIVAPLLESGSVELAEELVQELTLAMVPHMIVFALVVLALSLPKYFEMRMADYALLDDPHSGARMALNRSRAMLHGNKLELLKLDLSFWWFYLLDGLLLCLCYGDWILPMLGIKLPFDTDTAYFLFYLVYLVSQVGLYVLLRNRLECTYAAGYEALNRDLEEKLSQLQGPM